MSKNNTRPICDVCGIRPGRSAGRSATGAQLWRKICSSCDSKQYRRKKCVDLCCSVCGWVATDVCQIDVVDGSSICANCNRLRIKQRKREEHDNYELTVDATVNWRDVRL